MLACCRLVKKEKKKVSIRKAPSHLRETGKVQPDISNPKHIGRKAKKTGIPFIFFFLKFISASA